MDLVNVERWKVWASVGKMAQRSTVQVSAGKQVHLAEKDKLAITKKKWQKIGFIQWKGDHEKLIYLGEMD